MPLRRPAHSVAAGDCGVHVHLHTEPTSLIDATCLHFVCIVTDTSPAQFPAAAPTQSPAASPAQFAAAAPARFTTAT